MKKALLFAGILCGVLFLFGCKTKFIVSPELTQYAPQKIAIVPFKPTEHALNKIEKNEKNLEEKLDKEKRKSNPDLEKIKKLEDELTTSSLEKMVNWKASEELRTIFFSAFSDKRYRDVELYVIDERLKLNGYDSKKEVFNASPQELGKILGADAIIYGNVTRFTDLFLIITSIKSIKLHAQMVSVRDGKILWEASRGKTDWTGNVPYTPLGLITTVIDTVRHFFGRQIEDFAFKLCREMTKTIPDGFIESEIVKPRIDSFSVTPLDKKTKSVGDKFKFQLRGSPFNKAVVKINGVASEIDLDEDEKNPGLYKGEYEVRKGDDSKDAAITVSLISSEDKDIFSNWIENSQINIDTIAPKTPTEIKVTNLQTQVVLEWEPAKESDIKEYKIYKSTDNVSGFKEIGETKSSKYSDSDVVLNQRYSYRITAIDDTGNESDESEVVFGIPLKPGPTKISKNISSEENWYKESSPYIISSVIKIEKTGTLKINPGTIIRFEDGGIDCSGAFISKGAAEEPVIFESVKKKGFPLWGGIFLNRADDKCHVSYTMIKNAQNGLLIKDCSLVIESCQISDNASGIKITGKASPRISSCKIAVNGEDGILCEGASPVLSNNTIIENGRNGIFVKDSGAPQITKNNIEKNGYFEFFSTSSEIVSLDNNYWGDLNEEEFFVQIWGKVSLKNYLAKPAPADEIKEKTFKPDFPNQEEYKKKFDEAVWIFKTSPADAKLMFLRLLNPENLASGEIFKWLGSIERKLNHPVNAIEDLRKALLIEPDEDRIYYLLGMCYLDLNQTDKASEALKKSVDLNPNNEEAWKEIEKLNKN